MKALIKISMLILLLGFVFCSGTNTTKSDSPISKELETITEAELIEMVSYIASDEMKGRLAGDEGCKKAGDYIASKFEEIGLEPGMGDSYYQNFEFMKDMSVGEDTHFTVMKSDSELNLEYDKDYHIFTNSVSGSYKGEIVFAGYSITNDKYDDYKDIDVKGKYIIVFRGSPLGTSDTTLDPYFSSKLTRAMENEAAGFILVNGSLNVGDPQIISLYLGEVIPKIPIIQITWEGVNKLLETENTNIQELQKSIDENYEPNSFVFKNIKIDITVDLDITMKKTANIVGYFPGNNPDLEQEVIIVGAHYDHIGYGEIAPMTDSRELHPGADDNASGVAALIEIAEAFSQIKDKLNRTILFIGFSAEEFNMSGSIHYIKNPIFPLNNTILMCNIHKIGLIEYNEIKGGYYTEDVNELMMKIDERYDLELITITDTFTIQNSSQFNFYNAGIPFALFTTGFRDVLHSPDDTIDKIDFVNLTEITKLIFEFLYEADRQFRI